MSVFWQGVVWGVVGTLAVEAVLAGVLWLAAVLYAVRGKHGGW